MKLHFPASIVFALLCSCASQPSPTVALAADGTPSALIGSIEPLLRMPAGSASLRSYTRYYVESRDGDEHYVKGVFIRGKPGGAKLVSTLPLILDGGCDVLHLKFDVRKMQVIAFFCAGLA